MLVRRMMADLGDKDAYDRITNDSLERLMRHDWPGNVRELRNVVAVALAFGKEGPLDLAQHLAPLRPGDASRRRPAAARSRTPSATCSRASSASTSRRSTPSAAAT